MSRYIAIIGFENQSLFLRNLIEQHLVHFQEIAKRLPDVDELDLLHDYCIVKALEEVLQSKIFGCIGDMDTWRVFYKSHIRDILVYNVIRPLVEQYRLEGFKNQNYLKVLTTSHELVISYHQRF